MGTEDPRPHGGIIDEEIAFASRLADRDPCAWREFFVLYGDFVYSQIVNTLRHHRFVVPDATIQDLSQDFLLHLLEDDGRRLRSFRGRNGCRFAGWLRVVCVHFVLGFIRTRKGECSLDAMTEEQVHQILPPDDHAIADSLRSELDDQRRVEQILAEVATWSDRDQLIFRLYYQDQIPAAEVAAMFGIKENNLNQILFRMRERLRQVLPVEDGSRETGV